MASVTFLKEPGYTYDLFFIFNLYYNKDEKLPANIDESKAEEEISYSNKVLEPYLPISDDLLLFFYMNDNNLSFMMEKYFDAYKNEFASGKYTFSEVMSKLSNYEQVIDNMLSTYFRGVSEEKRRECKESLPVLSHLIKESKYPIKIKNALYAFFIDPVPIIQKLMQELVAKEILLNQQYQKAYQKMQGMQDNFNFQKFSDGFSRMKGHAIDIKNYEEVYVAFCLYSKNTIFCKFYEQKVLLMLGTDYDTRLDYLKNQQEIPSLELFGNAVSEKNRIEILNLMAEKKEVSVKDIEQFLGLTGTNAYYHLILMQKAGMLKSRTKGRMVYYSIDKNFFGDLAEMIDKYLH